MEVNAVLLRVDEVARLLQISRSRAYELASGGDLPVVRIGRQLRVPKESFEKCVANLRSNTTGDGDEKKAG